MKSALLGYTGFVGSALARQTHFDKTYNSKNIAEIDGKSFDLVVCAAVPGTKWLANAHPEDDWNNIQSLITHLLTIKAKQFILISTVDVYASPSDVDESSAIVDENQAYGKNRYAFEQFVTANFSRSIIIRLPALFGKGLKKNAVFDFIHDNRVAFIHTDSQYQYYNVANIWRDIQIVLKADLKLVNFVTEPLTSQNIYEAALHKTFAHNSSAKKVLYDVRSQYADLFGGKTYIADKERVLQELVKFILDERKKL